MKKLTIKGEFSSEVEELPDGTPQKYIIDDILKVVLKSPPQNVTYDEMASSIDLIRKLNKALKDGQAELLIENTEHTWLTGMLKAFKFPRRDPALYDWIKDIAELPDVAVQETKLKMAAKHK